jgi:hypothetical protein
MISLQKKYAMLCVLAVSLIGVVSLAFATRLGAGISPDSTVYVDAANNLLMGRGLSVQSGPDEFTPLAHFPPLFPALLAIVGGLGFDMSSGARWLNVLLFGGNILLVGLIVRRCAGSPTWASVLGAYFVWTSTGMLLVHSMAWTEPLFIFASLSGLLLLGIYIEGHKKSCLLASSVAVAMGFLARYIGATLVITGVTGIFLLSKQPLVRRLVDGVVFATLSSLAILLWLTRNLLVADNATNRALVFHPLSPSHARGAVHTLAVWLLPESVPNVTGGIIALIVVASAMAWFVLALRQRGWSKAIALITQNCEVIPYLFFVFAIVYVAFLVISISFVDAATSLNLRTMTPVYISVLILALYGGSKLLPEIGFRPRTRKVQTMYTILGLVFAASYLIRATGFVANGYSDGLGYVRQFGQSATLQRLEGFPTDAPVYSNGPDVIRALVGRFAYMVPQKQDPTSRIPNDEYVAELDTMKRRLAEGEGIIVWLDAVHRWYLPSEEELRNALPLELIGSQTDGAIYRLVQ